MPEKNSSSNSGSGPEMQFMYCFHCGKKIPRDSNLCGYCGTSVKRVPHPGGSQRSPGQDDRVSPSGASSGHTAGSDARKSGTQRSAETINTAPPADKKKKSGSSTGKHSAKTIILGVIIALIVGSVGRYAGQIVGSGMAGHSSQKTETTEEASKDTSESDSASSSDSTTAEADDSFDYFDATNCAVLKGHTLTYGPASIKLKGYRLYTPDSDDSVDYMVSSDNNSYFQVQKIIEINTSYDNSDEQSMLDSYENDDNWSDVTMLYFNKLYIGKYPCIRYSIKGTSDGKKVYESELIIMSSETADNSLRIQNTSYTRDAYLSAKEILKKASLCTDYSLYDDTIGVGLMKIKKLN